MANARVAGVGVEGEDQGVGQVAQSGETGFGQGEASLEGPVDGALDLSRGGIEEASGDEGGGKGEIHALTSAAMLYASEALKVVLDHGVQVHGGIGCMWEAEINRLYRANKVLEIGAGTNEIRELVISQELLR